MYIRQSNAAVDFPLTVLEWPFGGGFKRSGLQNPLGTAVVLEGMMTEWNPNIPRQAVRGTSAWDLGRNALVAACVGFVCLSSFIIGITVRG